MNVIFDGTSLIRRDEDYMTALISNNYWNDAQNKVRTFRCNTIEYNDSGRVSTIRFTN